MSGIGELLELLHGARRSYRTVRGVLRHRWKVSLSQEAHKRWERTLPETGTQSTSYAMMTSVGEGPPAEPPDRQEQIVRFWSEPPARLREEAEIVGPPRHARLTVRDGERWWTYSPEWGAMSNVGMGEEAASISVGGGELWQALLDPVGWIPALDFEPRGKAEMLGRPALRAVATRRTPSDGDASFFQAQLPVGADEYELLVDRERGVVLRAAGLLEGEEFWVCELEELVFDEKLPRETFIFEPPPGEEIHGPDLALHEPLTIEEAAERASFPIFYVPELPEGRWELHIMYFPARERPPMTESVHLVYGRTDATHHLMISEQPAEAREPDWVAYGPPGVAMDEVERGGISFTINRPEDRYGPLTIVLERDGTAIHLSSENLAEDVLLDLAASMRTLPAA